MTEIEKNGDAGNIGSTEKMEKILRAIHILISRGEVYDDNPDRVIISKREMFDTLEQLNLAVAEIMDNYEASATAKARAKRDVEETAMEIVNDANDKAEDVYAASLLYTDGALNELYDEVASVRAAIRSDLLRFESDIDVRMETFKANQKELLDSLRALRQGDKYFGLIEDYNRRLALAEAKQNERELIAKGGGKPQNEKQGKGRKKKKNDMQNIDDILSGKAFETEPVIPSSFRKRKGEPHAMGEDGIRQTEETSAGLLSLLEPDPEDLEDIQWPEEETTPVDIQITYNNNWGTKENNVLETSRFKTKRQRDREKKYGKKPDKKKSKYDFDDEPITLANDPDTDPDAPVYINSDSLDAEYEQWQSQQEKSSGTVTNAGKEGEPRQDVAENGDGKAENRGTGKNKGNDLLSMANGFLSKLTGRT